MSRYGRPAAVGRLLEQAEDPVAARAALAGRLPMGRLGTPEEVAQAAHHLASDAAAFVTGTEPVLDGGPVAAWTRAPPDTYEGARGHTRAY